MPKSGYFYDRKAGLQYGKDLTSDEFNPRVIPAFKAGGDFDLRPKLKAITAPVLLLQGRQDIAGEANIDEPHLLIRNSVLKFINKCRHMPWLDRVIDMVAQIDKWSGYVPAKSHKVPPDSPYQIDVVWLDRDLIGLAVEVQVGGNETEAKDRLVHAKRFGARKIVVVSKTESIKRLKEICRYEPDLKNWLEILSLAKVYRTYLAGQQFFELFQPFEKQ